MIACFKKSSQYQEQIGTNKKLIGTEWPTVFPFSKGSVTYGLRKPYFNIPSRLHIWIQGEIACLRKVNL